MACIQVLLDINAYASPKKCAWKAGMIILVQVTVRKRTFGVRFRNDRDPVYFGANS